MEAISVAVEMRFGAAYAQATTAMNEMEKYGSNDMQFRQNSCRELVKCQQPGRVIAAFKNN